MIDERDIDRVAAAMTDGEPSSALRARVMQQMAAGGRRSRRPARIVARALVATTLAAAVTLFVMTRPAPLVQPDTQRADATTPAPAPPPASTAGEVATANAANRPVRPSVPVAMSEAERAWQSRRLPALPAPAPLELEAIQPDPIAIAPITMEPIVRPAGVETGGRWF